MPPRNNFQRKLELSDFVCIELMKSDKDYAQFDANIDLNIDAGLKREYLAAPEAWFRRLIAERAAQYHQKKHGTDPAKLRKSVNQLLATITLITIGTMALLLVLNFLAVPKQLFATANNDANIAKLIWFTTIPLFAGLFALILSLFLLRSPKPKKHSSSWIWKIISFLSVPGVIALCWNGWRSLRGIEPSASEITLQEFARNKGRATSVCFLAISNLVICLLSFAALASLAYFLLFNEVGFTWESSILTEQNKKTFLEFTESLPGVVAPDNEAFRWANGATGPEITASANRHSGLDQTNAPTNYSRKELGIFRNQWSWYLLKSFFVAAICPRLLVGIVSIVLVISVHRDLSPKPSDSELAKIAKNIISPDINSETETVVDEIVETDHIEPKLSKTGLAASDTEGPQPPDQIHIGAYELRTESFESLERHFNDTNVSCKHISGAESRFKFLESLDNFEQSAVVLFVRATVVPDLAFETFAQKVNTSCMKRHVQIRTILLDSNQYLESVSGDADLLTHRKAQWKKAFKSSGLDLKNMAIANLDSKTGIAQIRELLKSPCQPHPKTGDAKMAGRFNESLELIKQGLLDACRSDSTLETNHWTLICEKMREKVLRIYSAEPSLFPGSINNLTNAGLKDVAINVEKINPLEHSPLGKEIYGKLETFFEYTKGLSPKWIVAGAIAGLGATVALPLLVGGASATPLIITALPYGGATGAAIGQRLKSFLTGSTTKSSGDSPKNDDEAFSGLNLDMSVHSLMLSIFFHEYQEFPHEVSESKFKEYADRCGNGAVDSDSKLIVFIDREKDCLQRDWETMQ